MMGPMRSGARLGWRRVLIVSGSVFFVALVLWLTLEVRHAGLGGAGKITSVVSLYATVGTFPLTVVSFVVGLAQRPTVAAMPPMADVEAAVLSLAVAVRVQLEAEERIRRIHDPFPLPVRWAGAPAHLMDHWPNIHGSAKRREAITLSGHGEHLADLLAQIPSRRLVVLGRAGAGKTIVASRLVLTLLDRRAEGTNEPVPVLLPVGSWDPTVATLRTWAVDQLASDHPILAPRDKKGVTLAAHLLDTHRVMLVLDGFDEISARLRVDAIRQINAQLGPRDWFALTSRPDEYAEAVETGDVLTACAVVQLKDLTVADVATYLPLTARRQHKNTQRTKWHPAVAALRRPDGAPGAIALRAALSTPLMVALARASYSDTEADPADLLAGNTAGANPDRLRVELEDRLLAGFIPAVYTSAIGDEGSPFPSWPVDGPVRWLRFLAGHLDRLQTQNIAWWQLSRAVPRPVIAVSTGTMVGAPTLLGVAIVRWTAQWTPAGRTIWTIAGVIFGVLCGLVAGTLAGTGRGMRPAPSRTQLRLHGQLLRALKYIRGQLFGWRAAAWIGTWTIGGLVGGLVARGSIGTSSVVISGSVAGLLLGFGLWFVVALVQGLGTVVDPTQTAGPGELLRSDRATGLRQGLISGAAGALLVVIVFWEQFERTYHMVSGSAFWVLAWVFGTLAATMMWVVIGMVWGSWLIARVWLALRGHLPWAVMTFLDDAHRRGVLRQAGGVYQFRHARLQQHLTTQKQ